MIVFGSFVANRWFNRKIKSCAHPKAVKAPFRGFGGLKPPLGGLGRLTTLKGLNVYSPGCNPGCNRYDVFGTPGGVEWCLGLPAKCGVR